MADILEPAEDEMTMLIRGRWRDVRDAPKTPMFWTGCFEYMQMESLDQEIWQAKEMLKWAHRVAVTQFEERARIENKDKRKVKVELTALVSTLKREKYEPECMAMIRLKRAGTRCA